MSSKILALAAVSLLAGPTAAGATIFDFSYQFASSPDVVTGSFTGTANGNLITNLSNVSVAFDGIAFVGNPNLFANSVDQSIHYVSGGAVVSFDGTQNSFLFIDCDYTYAVACPFTNFFADLTGPNSSHSGTPQTYRAEKTPLTHVRDDTFGYVGQWSVTARAVPESSTLALLSVGFAAIGFTRRRKASCASRQADYLAAIRSTLANCLCGVLARKRL